MRQALQRFDDWVGLFGELFPKLHFGSYNQLMNHSPLLIVGQTPVLAYIVHSKIDELRSEGFVSINLATEGRADEWELIGSLIKSNYKR